jgi:hypothetical protein
VISETAQHLLAAQSEPVGAARRVREDRLDAGAYAFGIELAPLGLERHGAVELDQDLGLARIGRADAQGERVHPSRGVYGRRAPGAYRWPGRPASIRVELDGEPRAGLAHALEADQAAAVGAQPSVLAHLDGDAQGLVGEEQQPAREMLSLVPVSVSVSSRSATGASRLRRFVRRWSAVLMLSWSFMIGSSRSPALLRPVPAGT